MYVAINGAGKNKSVYIMRSFRKDDGKTSTRVYRTLGRLDDLLQTFSGDQEKMMAWAKEEAKKDTEEFRHNYGSISIDFSKGVPIPLDEPRVYNIGYLFLQQLCTQLHLENICRKIRSRRKCTYDLGAILTDLIYARILSPSSKLSSYSFCQNLLEPPKYSLQNVYRALSILAEESDFMQEQLYRNSNFVHPRNTKILYYDCTNFYFEIEQEDGIKRYGKSKEHRPNPIVTMGLFMDADGFPLAFDIFPGNQNEQKTLKPLETRIIRDFECSEFIFCSDAGLGSKANRQFNSFAKRSYVITHSLKKMAQEDQKVALDPACFRRLGSPKMVNLSELDEDNEAVFQSIYYKEIPLVTGNMDETLIVTYSPKYKAYQREVRRRQIERAQKMLKDSGSVRRRKGQNDPARFIKRTSVTEDGEIAENMIYELDEERIREEARYDGFYAVVTNIEGDVSQILKINQRRWEIEECFRIMKSEFEARPVYVRREDRIKAHFLTCWISLLVYRLLEKKMGEAYSCRELLQTLRNMRVTRLSKESGYIPSYTRTAITDALHDAFGFRTDYEFIPSASMRNMIKMTKQEKTRQEKEI